jgi:hypothetical protein
MQCPNCQNEVHPNQLFCDNCGRDLSDLQATVTSDATDPANVASNVDADPPPPSPPVAAGAEDAAAAQPMTPVAPPSSKVTQAQLVIADGSASYDLPAGREILIGRVDPIDGIYPDIDLTPHDPAVGVSRRHATLHEQGGQWFLKDHQSTNYTIVNRQRLNPDQDYLLDDGDEIRFGRVVARFRLGIEA